MDTVINVSISRNSGIYSIVESAFGLLQTSWYFSIDRDFNSPIFVGGIHLIIEIVDVLIISSQIIKSIYLIDSTSMIQRI